MSSSMPQPSAPLSIPVAVAVAEPVAEVHAVVDHESPSSHGNNDAANEAAAAAAREQGTSMIRDHLDAHLSLNPGSSYVTWIAALHPENATVAIDPRFLTPGNPWMVVYQEAKADLHRKPAGGATATATVENVPEESATHSPPANGATEKSDEKTYGGFLDLVFGFAILIMAISIAFSVELIGLYTYGSSVLCHKIYKACSRPRVTILTALPFGICWLLYQVFRLVDVMLLFVSVMIIELMAGINYFICALFSLDCDVGRSAHQRTRRLAHLTRWAFRHKFGDCEPKRASMCSSRSNDEVPAESLMTPTDDRDGKKTTPVLTTVAPIPEKEQLYDS